MMRVTQGKRTYYHGRAGRPYLPRAEWWDGGMAELSGVHYGNNARQ